MSDTVKANQTETPSADNEKLLTQARMALKTGASAYENENYAFAETLFIKSLDLFEQVGKLDDRDYFQCLHHIADTYFQLGRYFEAKSYYERLSVARLKNPDSTDAQVVVALLKLAATYEKLGESAEALTAFDLIMELAEKTIPTGHALFGVIFDSYEGLIAREVSDPAEIARREAIIVEKREQFGFSKTSTEARWASALAPEQEGESENVLSQGATQIRKNLKAWTQPGMTRQGAALGEAVSKVNQERISSLENRPVGERPEGVMTAHLHPDMFRRKPLVEREAVDEVDDRNMVGEEGLQEPAADIGETSRHSPALGGELVEALNEQKPSLSAMRSRTAEDKSSLKNAKRLNTDRKRINPLPALTVIVCLAAVGGAVFVAHEYVKNAGDNSVTVKDVGATDYSGRSWSSADSHKMLRCLGPVQCEYTTGGASATGTYQIKGQKVPEKSVLSDFFNGKSTRLEFTEVDGDLKSSDGTVLYSDSSKDRSILTKAQAIANFATYYFAQHEHVYPGSANDFQAGKNKFAWENPISGKVNQPVVQKVTCNTADFENTVLSQLKSMREGKFLFEGDSATSLPAGLIECMEISANPPADAKDHTDAGSAFLIRAYDSQGKLICASDPKKTYVYAQKNGVSIDPAKVLHEDSAATALTPRVEVMIIPQAPAAKSEPAK